MKVGGNGAERTRGLLTGVAAVALLAGALTLGTGLGHAATSCAGLDATLRRDRDVIAEQQARPNALSAARIAGRRSSMKITERRRAALGCPELPTPAQHPAAARR